MIHIDRFLDTKEKRQYMMYLLVLLFMIWMAFLYIQNALTLISLETYDEMYSALTTSTLDGCYLARFILQSMSMSEIQVETILKNIFISMRIEDVVFVFVCFFICIEHSFRSIRKKLLCIQILFILQFMFVVVLALVASNMDSLQGVINYVRGIGWSILLVQSVLLVHVFLLVVHTLKDYDVALQYDAIEINEE